MNWIYKGKEVTEVSKEDEGFVYRITHLPTGRYYIGKKSLWTRRNKKIGKREKQRLRAERKEKGIGGRLPQKKLVVKESKWREYYSSNDWIQAQVDEGKADEFKREILKFYPNKKALTYGEVEYQIKNDCLKDDNCINNTILGKFYSKDII